jgi:hypothetical protein
MEYSFRLQNYANIYNIRTFSRDVISFLLLFSSGLSNGDSTPSTSKFSTPSTSKYSTRSSTCSIPPLEQQHGQQQKQHQEQQQGQQLTKHCRDLWEPHPLDSESGKVEQHHPYSRVSILQHLSNLRDDSDSNEQYYADPRHARGRQNLEFSNPARDNCRESRGGVHDRMISQSVKRNNDSAVVSSQLKSGKFYWSNYKVSRCSIQ